MIFNKKTWPRDKNVRSPPGELTFPTITRNYDIDCLLSRKTILCSNGGSRTLRRWSVFNHPYGTRIVGFVALAMFRYSFSPPFPGTGNRGRG